MAANSSPSPLYAGIDLGGTKVLALVGTADGQVLGERLVPTRAADGPEAVVDAMVSAVQGAIKEAKVSPSAVAATGVASAGAIDHGRGVVVSSPNLPGWDQVPLVAMLRQRLDTPVALDNDANLAALAEHRLGAGRGAHNLLFITVSTGVGGGIIINDHLYRGAMGYAGEVGHITVKADGPECKCGSRGCLESLVSGTALAREAQSRLRSGEPSLLQEMARGRGAGAITAKLLFDALHQGDGLARTVVNEAILYLAHGLTSLVNILNPDRLIIGGGLSQQWEAYIQPAVELMREQAFAEMGRDLPVTPPELGVSAGALGALVSAVPSA